MTRTRKWVSGTAVLVLIVLAAGWFLLVSPKKSEAATLQAQALGQQATNDGLRAKVAQLKGEAALKPQQEAKLALFKQRVPETPAEPSLVRQLQAIAKQAGVKIESFTAADPTGLNVPNAPAADKDNILEQMTVTVTVEGTYFSAERFLNLIEGLKRVMIVTGLEINNVSDVITNNALDPTAHKYVISGRVFRVTNGTAAPSTTSAPASPGTSSPTKVQ